MWKIILVHFSKVNFYKQGSCWFKKYLWKKSYYFG
ncbi:MAG: hypothetical protein MRERC_1c136 [Mycoplasmataceae bacterium RC_NB112A]|nr:MAG: hypothetical protein MRERC_1c136 [Mycoplasmataceae bacterium RC_NB112A]